MKMNKEYSIKIPLGAKDSEFIEETITIPDGCYVTIEEDKVVIKKGFKSQDKELQSLLELAEDHAMLAGMNKIEEELKQNAISCIVDEDSPYLFLDYNPEQEHSYLEKKGFKPGDKVKVIVIKDE